MKEHNSLNLNGTWTGILSVILIGLLGYGIKLTTQFHIADPLLVSLILGIAVRTTLGTHKSLEAGFVLAPRIFIPAGIVFYSLHNLNFTNILKVETSMLVLLLVVLCVYFTVIILFGKLLRQRKEITYLTATGSSICGASAIAITSSAIDAEPEDISISLLSVAIAAFVGLFIILPFLATLFNISGETYGLLSGTVLQFTGFVKAAIVKTPHLKSSTQPLELLSLALSVKALRYFGLLIVIPISASLIRNKPDFPWVLWVFLVAGLIGTLIYVADSIFYTVKMIPFIKPIHEISWSIAMAAIGLNADARELLSNYGHKALVMAFAGFFAATVIFFIGLHVIQLF